MIHVKNIKELEDITRYLSAVAARVDNLAAQESNSGTDFCTHKSLNIAYKELDAIRMMFLSMLGNRQFTKGKLIKTDLGVQTRSPGSVT